MNVVGGRTLSVERSFDSLPPFFGRYFERNLFEFHQQADDRVIDFKFAVIAILVRRQRGTRDLVQRYGCDEYQQRTGGTATLN